MSDESRLEQAVSHAARAQELLDNDLLSEAFATLEQGYISAWRATTIEDVAAREKLFLAINIVGKVRDHLTSAVADGKLAQVQLKELAQAAERRRRFGII
jgi:DNA integrity scanning protein DisA with diadenylate cyclase activity